MSHPHRTHFVALLVVATFSAGCLTYQDVFFYGNEAVTRYQDLYLGGSTAAPKLAWQPDPGAAHPLGSAAATQGATAIVAQTLEKNVGSSPVAVPVDVFQSDPVPYDLHLNASHTIQGTIFVQSQAATAGSQGFVGDNVRFDIELWAGERFLGGVMRNYSTCFVPCDAGEFLRIHVHIQPETDLIEKDTVLTLKLYHVAHMTGIAYGTKAPHLTHLRFSLYSPEDWSKRSTDPTGLRNDPPEDEEPPSLEQSASDGPWLPITGAAGVVGLGAFSARRMGRRRTIATLLGLAFLTVAFGGCFGSPDGDSKAPDENGAVEATIVPGSTIKIEEGYGAIAGQIKDDLGLAVPGAHVAVRQTSNFTSSDQEGRFLFPHLAPRDYVIRIDAQEFISIEDTVEVRAGNVTFLNVTMQPTTIKGAGYRPHLHDYWSGLQRKTFFDGPVSMRVYDGGTGATSSLGQPRALCMNYYVYYNYGCVVEFYFDPADVIILPGTRFLDVTIKWDASQNRVPRVGFGFQSNDLSRFGPYEAPINSASFMYPKASGAVTRVPVNWEMTDVGHQRFTLWKFYLWIPTYSGANNCACMSWTQLVQAPFQVSIVGEKGVLPVEPPHVDFWQGMDTYVVLQDKILEANCFCNYPHESAGWSIPDRLVPPGTKRVEAWLTWTEPTTTHPWKWGLAYRPGNVPPRGMDGLVTATPAGDSTATMLHYDIAIQSGQTDAFYQRNSNWRFWPADDVQGQNQVGATYSGGTTAFKLTVHAHRA